ncbi:hypothetical protein BLOT_014301 [Blomia tropicalis]|nr:hypothetical protein BLOT_014301 [Blomia tropicalis]
MFMRILLHQIWERKTVKFCRYVRNSHSLFEWLTICERVSYIPDIWIHYTHDPKSLGPLSNVSSQK